MDAITIQSVAFRLHGSEYPLTVSADLKTACKAAGIVIVYGASDDLMEFDGAIYDELGAYDGTTAYVDAKGLLDREQIDDDNDEAITDYTIRKRTAKTIEAIWDQDDISWQYRTNIPHATFAVAEGGETYCIGIVFELAELAKDSPT